MTLYKIWAKSISKSSLKNRNYSLPRKFHKIFVFFWLALEFGRFYGTDFRAIM